MKISWFHNSKPSEMNDANECVLDVVSLDALEPNLLEVWNIVISELKRQRAIRSRGLLKLRVGIWPATGRVIFACYEKKVHRLFIFELKIAKLEVLYCELPDPDSEHFDREHDILLEPILLQLSTAFEASVKTEELGYTFSSIHIMQYDDEETSQALF